MFWKHKRQIVLVWVILSAIAVGVVYKLPAVYKAEATILVDSQKIPDKYVMPTVNTAIEDRVLTLKKEILAYDSLVQIINKFNLYADQRKSHSQEEIVDLMTADTDVELEKGWTRDRPGAFKISYQGSDPRVVADVANDIAARFIEKNTTTREEHASDTSRFLADQLEKARKDLADEEAKVSAYKLQHNGELPEQEASLDSILSRMQVELQGNQDAINRAQQQKLTLENAISDAESSLAAMTALAEQLNAGRTANGDAPQRQPKESDVLQARLDVLRVRYSDDHPEVKRLRAEIAQLRESERRMAADATKGTTQASAEAAGKPASDSGAPLQLSRESADRLVKERERLANLKGSLALANRELEMRNAERQKILDGIRVYEAKLERLPLRQQDMAGITRDYEISKEEYKRLLENKVSADMAAAMELQQQAEKFMPLQSARPPEVPFKPVRPLWISVGCVAALVLSLITAAIRELRAGAFLGEWELPSEVAVLGRVPWIAMPGGGFEELSDAGSGSWLQRKRWQALVFSLVLSLVCVIAAAFYRGWMKF